MSLSKNGGIYKGEGERAVPKPPTEEEKRVYIKNKFNPSSTEIQRQQMLELLKHPEREIVIPKPQKRTLSPPPELVSNIAGSSAGAGSGEFHVYKQARRKEFERMKIFAEEEEKEKTEKEFALQKSLHSARDDAKTEKNRLKRLKRRGNRAKSSNPASSSAVTSNTEATQVEASQEESSLNKEHSYTPALVIAEPKGIEIIEDDF